MNRIWEEKKVMICVVMRYVGPRMLFIHPIATLLHLYRELK